MSRKYMGSPHRTNESDIKYECERNNMDNNRNIIENEKETEVSGSHSTSHTYFISLDGAWKRKRIGFNLRCRF